MGLDKLIELAAVLAVLAVSSGHLPQIIHAVHVAQLHLIKDSQASSWPKAQLLPIHEKSERQNR